MPLVRVLSWNIYHFSTNRAGAALAGANAHRCNIILDEVHPAGAPPNYDLFIVIEVTVNKPTAYANVGNLAVAGATGGMNATQQLKAQLQARAAAGGGGGGTWEVVPPVFQTVRKFAEAISIFFHSPTLVLTGPLQDVTILAGSPWRTPATLHGAGGTWKGQARFWTGGVGPEKVFDQNPQRRPYMVNFTAGGVAFSVVSHHSPSPKGPANVRAQQGTAALAEIEEITTLRANPVIITGDFNCCTANPCPNNGCFAGDQNAQDELTGPGGAAYQHTKDALIVMHKAIEATNAAETAAFEHAQAVAATAVANAAGAALAANNARNATIAAGQRTTEAIVAHGRVTAVPVGAAGAGAAASAPPALTGAHVADALAYKNLALAARNQLLLMSGFYNAATTAFLQNYSQAIASAAAAIDTPGVAGAHAVNAGNFANLAVGAVAGVPVPSAAAAAAGVMGGGNAIALAQAGGAINGAAGVTLAKNARDAIRTVASQIYTSHVYMALSSLKGAAARPLSYKNHAFDHVLTIGAVEVTNAEVRDLVPATITAYHAVAYAPGMALNSFRAGFKYIAIWGKRGVSDHLPVRAHVTI